MYLHYPNAYGNQIWQGGDILGVAPLHKSHDTFIYLSNISPLPLDPWPPNMAGGNLQLGNPTCKVIWTFKYVVSQDHVTIYNSKKVMFPLLENLWAAS